MMDHYVVDKFYAYYRGWRLDLSMGEEMLNRAMDAIDRMLARRLHR